MNAYDPDMEAKLYGRAKGQPRREQVMLYLQLRGQVAPNGLPSEVEERWLRLLGRWRPGHGA